MQVSRRGLLGMLAAGAGAAIIRTPGLLMPIKTQFVEIEQNFGFIEFTGFTPLYNPNSGDTVTLNGVEYQFTYTTTGPREVLFYGER